jgi:hypothetical protein
MDAQQRFALEQMIPWVKGTGIIEIRRALVICAEEASQSGDSDELAARLIRRIDAPEPPKAKAKATGKKGKPEDPTTETEPVVTAEGTDEENVMADWASDLGAALAAGAGPEAGDPPPAE